MTTPTLTTFYRLAPMTVEIRGGYARLQDLLRDAVYSLWNEQPECRGLVVYADLTTHFLEEYS